MFENSEEFIFINLNHYFMISRKCIVTGICMFISLGSFAQKKEKLNLPLESIWSGFFDEKKKQTHIKIWVGDLKLKFKNEYRFSTRKFNSILINIRYSIVNWFEPVCPIFFWYLVTCVQNNSHKKRGSQPVLPLTLLGGIEIPTVNKNKNF